MIFVHSVVNCDQIKKIECLFSFKTIVEKITYVYILFQIRQTKYGNKSTTDLIFVYNICEIASFSPRLEFCAETVIVPYSLSHKVHANTRKKEKKVPCVISNSAATYLVLHNCQSVFFTLSKLDLQALTKTTPSLECMQHKTENDTLVGMHPVKRSVFKPQTKHSSSLSHDMYRPS